MEMINVEQAVSHIQACENFDGSYGRKPGAESHAGQVFTCLGALAIAKRLDLVNRDKIGAWLSERQLPNGGLNGRPEKLEDVCYSWWVLSSLAMIDRLHWIDGDKMISFILKCQVGRFILKVMDADTPRMLSTVAFLIGRATWSTSSTQCLESQASVCLAIPAW